MVTVTMVLNRVVSRCLQQSFLYVTTVSYSCNAVVSTNAAFLSMQMLQLGCSGRNAPRSSVRWTWWEVERNTPHSSKIWCALAWRSTLSPVSRCKWEESGTLLVRITHFWCTKKLSTWANSQFNIHWWLGRRKAESQLSRCLRFVRGGKKLQLHC